MKIPVENNLDEIINELKRLGFKEDLIGEHSISVAAYSNMTIDGYDNLDIHEVEFCELTTLAELKLMK